MSTRTFINIALCLVWLSAGALAASGPFDGKNFKGRIAYSADGNCNDPDDWSASPISLAILAACGLQEKLVHFDYNCIMPKTDPEWEKQHATGVLGAAERHGFKKELFHDCQKDLQGAITSIKNAINASSADDPLYFIVAGPMEVPVLGIEQSDPAKRQFVTCISHSVWNDGYNTKPWLIRKTKRDVIALGVHWVQIPGQGRLATGPGGGEARASRPEEWKPWLWMQESGDPNLQFLLERTKATTRADCSDSGMTYFLISGDETADLAKYKALLQDKKIPKTIDPRRQIRLEAENFSTLEDCEPVFGNTRQVSQRVHVAFKGQAGRIRTVFHEPYSAGGRYDIEIRHAGGKGAGCEFQLLVGGKAQGAAWKGKGQGWQSHTVPGVTVNEDDEIAVEVKGDAGLDYVQLNGPGIGSAAQEKETKEPK